MSRALFAGGLAFPIDGQPELSSGREGKVPPEVLSSGGQSAQPLSLSAAFIRIKIILKAR
ncbi:hypothetical protein ACNKHX_08960 [Shigella flexneri]